MSDQDLLQMGAGRYQAAQGAYSAYAQVHQRRLALIVGALALALPGAMLLGVANPIWPTCMRDSISHFYYAPFLGSVFVGILFFIGAYLIVYRGEDAGGAERRLATLAGLCALGVAVFPTSGAGCDAAAFEARAMAEFTRDGDALALVAGQPVAAYFTLFPGADKLHYLSALGLFAFLAWFALRVFTAVDPDQRGADGRLTRAKQVRNAIYHASGAAILLCILALVLSSLVPAAPAGAENWWQAGNWTFWVETMALVSFGVSWLVKGRFLGRWLDDA